MMINIKTVEVFEDVLNQLNLAKHLRKKKRYSW